MSTVSQKLYEPEKIASGSFKVNFYCPDVETKLFDILSTTDSAEVS